MTGASVGQAPAHVQRRIQQDVRPVVRCVGGAGTRVSKHAVCRACGARRRKIGAGALLCLHLVEPPLRAQMPKHLVVVLLRLSVLSGTCKLRSDKFPTKSCFGDWDCGRRLLSWSAPAPRGGPPHFSVLATGTAGPSLKSPCPPLAQSPMNRSSISSANVRWPRASTQTRCRSSGLVAASAAQRGGAQGVTRSASSPSRLLDPATAASLRLRRRICS